MLNNETKGTITLLTDTRLSNLRSMRENGELSPSQFILRVSDALKEGKSPDSIVSDPVNDLVEGGNE